MPRVAKFIPPFRRRGELRGLDDDGRVKGAWRVTQRRRMGDLLPTGLGLVELKYLTFAWRVAWMRLSFIILIALATPWPAYAQGRPEQRGQPAAAAPIDRIVVDKLVWATIIALDQANRTGNYSVLRDLGAPSFQTNNSAATLGGIFATLRNQRFDLSNALIVSPVYLQPPATQGSDLRAKGIFPLRPTAVGFDLMFQNISGEWRLLGISVAPLAAHPAVRR